MKVMGVTHQEFDFDGGSCLRLLERAGLIQECIFGDEELKSKLAANIDKLIFVDFSPKEVLSGIDTKVYDHHQSESADDRDKTAFDILIDAIGTCGFDSEKINAWRKLVWLTDKKAEADDMDIARALKKVHLLLENDREVYTRWFTLLFDSFLANKPDLGRAIKALQGLISQFISENPDSPANPFLRRWSERVQDREKISRSTIRNLIHFLACIEEDAAKEWIWLLLEGYDKEQTEFQNAKSDFGKADVKFYGNTLIISAVTKSSRFKQVATHMVYSTVEKDINPLIREKIKDRSSPWLVMLVNPKNKNFQIFVNGNKTFVHQIIAELIKAIRAEILLKRNLWVPDQGVLSEGGTIKDTEPLYFHKLETGYPSILWGSLKHPAEAAIEFGNTSAEIHSRLIEIVRLALDENEYAEGCNPLACKDCPIYLWQLKKCFEKRKINS